MQIVKLQRYKSGILRNTVTRIRYSLKIIYVSLISQEVVPSFVPTSPPVTGTHHDGSSGQRVFNIYTRTPTKAWSTQYILSGWGDREENVKVDDGDLYNVPRTPRAIYYRHRCEEADTHAHTCTTLSPVLLYRADKRTSVLHGTKYINIICQFLLKKKKNLRHKQKESVITWKFILDLFTEFEVGVENLMRSSRVTKK